MALKVWSRHMHVKELSESKFKLIWTLRVRSPSAASPSAHELFWNDRSITKARLASLYRTNEIRLNRLMKDHLRYERVSGLRMTYKT